MVFEKQLFHDQIQSSLAAEMGIFVHYDERPLTDSSPKKPFFIQKPFLIIKNITLGKWLRHIGAVLTARQTC